MESAGYEERPRPGGGCAMGVLAGIDTNGRVPRVEIRRTHQARKANRALSIVS